jgi:hypothetical protein
MSRLLRHSRRHSKASIASDTGYHSFERDGLHEPVTQCDSGKEAEPLPASYGMHRQDSGYESMTPVSPPTYSRRRSSTSVSSYGSRTRNRPCVRRAPKSGPVVCTPRDSIQKIRTATCGQGYRQREIEAYYFPHSASEQHGLPLNDSMGGDGSAAGAATYATDSGSTSGMGSPPSSGTATYPSPPPQTTHYWTSDRTRRLEYAAIDAASRGVRGWVMRHMVPDCFIPEDHRRVRFDDDRGSVVRYRLDLDGDDRSQTEGIGGTKKRKSWWFSTNPS